MDDVATNEYSILILSAVGGDRDSLLELLLDVQHDLGQFVAFKTGHTANAQFNQEDFLQDVFVQAFRKIKSLRASNRAGFFAWLKSIATNQIVDLARQRNATKRGGDRIRVECKANSYSRRAVDLVAQLSDIDGGTPSHFAARNEAIEAMKIALADLPEDQRQAMQLHFFELMSLKETANKMGRSFDAVRGLVQRAKVSLNGSMHRSSLWFSKKE